MHGKYSASVEKCIPKLFGTLMQTNGFGTSFFILPSKSRDILKSCSEWGLKILNVKDIHSCYYNSGKETLILLQSKMRYTWKCTKISNCTHTNTCRIHNSKIIFYNHWSKTIQSVFLVDADLFLPKSIFWHDIDPHSHTMHAREAG